MARGAEPIERRHAAAVAFPLLLSACLVDALGTGKPVERCNTASDCSLPGPCLSPACEDGFCVALPVPDGLTPNQQAGDCETARCVAGVLEVVADPDDEDDGIPCTQDACTDAGPEHLRLPVGTPCVLGTVDGECSEGGECVVECSDLAPCPVIDPCEQAACVNDVCVYSPVTGEPVLSVRDEPGDCQAPSCDDGTLISVEDAADLPPDDGLPCTGAACQAGAPAHPALPQGTMCGVDLVCDGAGVCDGCTNNSQCGAVQDCVTPTCTAANECVDMFDPPHTPCPLGVCNAGGACVECADATDCGPASECSYFSCPSDACVPEVVPAGSACLLTVGFRCDLAGQCVECLGLSDCPAPSPCLGQACVTGSCTPQPVAPGDPCLIGAGVCNAGGACVGCVDPSDCPVPPVCRVATCTSETCGLALAAEGSVCPTGFCSSTGNCVECTLPTHCSPPQICCNGACQSPPCP